jgi:predicted HTH domain antitoxin
MDRWALEQPVSEMPLGKFKELVKEAVTEARKQIAELKVAYAIEVEQQEPDLLAEDRSVGDMTVGELRALLREILEEEWRRDYYIDEEGSLVFFSEEAYASYLDKQEGKLPSEVNAYFFDEQGFRAIYCDYEPTPEKARELDEARKQIAEGKVHSLEDVIERLGLKVSDV